MKSLRLVAPLLVLVYFSGFLEFGVADGFFQPFGFPKTVISTGQTEAVGAIHLALRDGTTLSDTLAIDLSPYKITNAAATDITVTASGNVTVGVVVIDADKNRVLVPVNAGGTSGSLRIERIRIAVAGTGTSTVSAQLSFLSFKNLLVPSSTVQVVSGVQSGMQADPMTDRFFIFNNQVVDTNASFKVREGFPSAFSSTLIFGQNGATRVRVRVSDFPVGLNMTFPVSITSGETAATLTTLEGTPVILPRSDGTTEVTYQFSGAGDSGDTAETFTIPFTVGVTGTVGILQPTIEVSLAPIGAALPTLAFPSTSVPRFAEDNVVVLAGTSRTITKRLYWTGFDASRTHQLSFFNAGKLSSNITIEGFTSTGSSVGQPVLVTLALRQLLTQTLPELFGTQSANVASVRVSSTSRDVLAVVRVTGPDLADSATLTEPDANSDGFVLPISGDGARVALLNVNPNEVSGTILLRAKDGNVLATKRVSLAPLASVYATGNELFNASAEGYIEGVFNGPVVATESYGTRDVSLAAAASGFGEPAVYAPFVVSGAGYSTELSVLNTWRSPYTIAATFLSSSGNQVGSTASITLAPGRQFVDTVSHMFALGQGLSSGYIRLSLPPQRLAFFEFYPSLTGYVRIRAGDRAETTVPLPRSPHQETFVLGVGGTTGQFQGIALLNPGASPTTADLQLMTAAGTVIAQTTVVLGAGQMSSKLLAELFPATTPGRAVVVTADSPILVLGIAGDSNGQILERLINFP